MIPFLRRAALTLALAGAAISGYAGTAMAWGGPDCGTRKIRALTEFYSSAMNEESVAAHSDEVTGLVNERVDKLRSKVVGEARTRIEHYLDDSYDGYDRPSHDDILSLLNSWVDETRAADILASCSVPEAEAIITTDILSVCRKVEATESHYLRAIADRFRALVTEPRSLIECESVADIAPTRCHLSSSGIPTDTYYSSSFPEREARIRLDLDGYDSYLRQWKDVPRDGKRFRFLICAQSSAMSPHGEGSAIGVQSVRGCARFDLRDLLQGDAHLSLHTTTQDEYVRAQSDWCEGS